MQQNSSDDDHRRGDLIPRLAEVQERHGYHIQEELARLSKQFSMSPSQVYGIATFYSHFRFTPPGEHILQVCMGTACHVKGGGSLLTLMRENYDIEPGQTTKDRRIELKRVACLGCCALAPVVVLDGETYGEMTPEHREALKQVLLAAKNGSGA